jgi:hypothetical protein
MLDGVSCVVLFFLPMANWVKMLDTGPNDPLHKCAVRIWWMRTGMESISALPCNPNRGHGLAGTVTSNKTNRAIYNTPAKIGV